MLKLLRLILPTLLILTGFLSNGQVVINEFSCSNISTIGDDIGNFEDWIELHNPTGAAVNIGGC
ncbi:MAG TPA: hypothetical protein PK281_09195, partial [Flavobacteriales bacterium]|nr:hypothetical protein [Flavobacteriales bacterium]